MKKLTIGIGLVFLVVGVALSINFTAFNRAFYTNTQIKYNIADDVNLNQEEVDKVMGVLLDYLEDKRDDLDYTLTTGQQAFNQREIDHMVDVKVLYQNLMLFIYVFGAVLLIVLVGYFVKKQSLTTLLDNYLKSTMIFMVILVLIIGYALIDFNSFWIAFHELVFTNDLWLLNPATDLLINLVPEPLFFDLVFRIIVNSVLFIVVTNIVARLVLIRLRRKYD